MHKLQYATKRVAELVFCGVSISTDAAFANFGCQISSSASSLSSNKSALKIGRLSCILGERPKHRLIAVSQV